MGGSNDDDDSHDNGNNHTINGSYHGSEWLLGTRSWVSHLTHIISFNSHNIPIFIYYSPHLRWEKSMFEYIKIFFLGNIFSVWKSEASHVRPPEPILAVTTDNECCWRPGLFDGSFGVSSLLFACSFLYDTECSGTALASKNT